MVFKSELIHDFRFFYKLSIYDIGETITWEEAEALIYGLLRHSDSLYQAKKANWAYPASMETLALYDVIDILANHNRTKNSKPIKAAPARPWQPKPEVLKGTAVSWEKAKELYKI